MARAQGGHEKARALLQEGVALARAIEKPADRMHPLAGMGHLARDLGEYQRAEELYQESLGLRREVRDTFAIAQSLEDFAVLAGREQQWERAARLLGAAEAVCTGLGRTPPVAGPEDYKRAVTGARTALGEAAFTAAWAEGRALPLDEAVAFALQERDGTKRG